MGAVIGYGGLEGAGSDLLLRSVVIDGRHRGMGAGRRLVERLLAWAKAGGAKKVWLLTTDAADFFRRLGFAEVERAEVPAAITASRQFGEQCPARARLLVSGETCPWPDFA